MAGKNRALITGITGQDGAYLASHLLSMGYEVAGIQRRITAANPLWRLEALLGDRVRDIRIIAGDLLDQRSIDAAVESFQPTHVFNLAAQSFVGASFTEPYHTMLSTGFGAVTVFNACRDYADKGVRIYQASSSEMFGSSPAPQREDTPMRPCSPYGCAKLYAHTMANTYRHAYGMHIACGILFNHESPLRGGEFVTQSIAKQVARCAVGLSREIRIGNLDARRDWGFAGDYVRGMEMLVNHHEPIDLILATGKSWSVRDFLNTAMLIAADMDPSYDSNLRMTRVVVDESLIRARPYEVPDLLGDATAAERVIGWKPEVEFKELARLMVVHTVEAVRKTASISTT